MSISTFVDYREGMARTTHPDVRLLAALADPVRLSIVRQLAACASVCACNFSDVSEVSQPTVSHHLRVLREAGVVISERRGSWVYYRLTPEAIGRLNAIARELVPRDLVPAADLVRSRRLAGADKPLPLSTTAPTS